MLKLNSIVACSREEKQSQILVEKWNKMKKEEIEHNNMPASST